MIMNSFVQNLELDYKNELLYQLYVDPEHLQIHYVLILGNLGHYLNFQLELYGSYLKYQLSSYC